MKRIFLSPQMIHRVYLVGVFCLCLGVIAGALVLRQVDEQRAIPAPAEQTSNDSLPAPAELPPAVEKSPDPPRPDRERSETTPTITDNRHDENVPAVAQANSALPEPTENIIIPLPVTETGLVITTGEQKILQGGSVPSGVHLSTDRTSYLPGEIITITLTNTKPMMGEGRDLHLAESAPWQIVDDKKNLVFAPIAAMAIITLEEGESLSWQWRQEDKWEQQVAPGNYAVTIPRLKLSTPFAVIPMSQIDPSEREARSLPEKSLTGSIDSIKTETLDK